MSLEGTEDKSCALPKEETCFDMNVQHRRNLATTVRVDLWVAVTQGRGFLRNYVSTIRASQDLATEKADTVAILLQRSLQF